MATTLLTTDEQHWGLKEGAHDSVGAVRDSISAIGEAATAMAMVAVAKMVLKNCILRCGFRAMDRGIVGKIGMFGLSVEGLLIWKDGMRMVDDE